jgi:molecular chaperone Hsp33
MSSTDSVLRAITDDGSFRVITTRTTETVRGIVQAQSAESGTARILADLTTGVILLRETLAPGLRIQGILTRRDVRASLVADSNPTGDTRGLVSLPEGTKDFSLDGSVFQLMRTLHNGQINQGMVEVPKVGGISRAMMGYIQSSEQITTMMAVGAVFEADTIVAAGGYLVQLLPEADRGPLAVMTERLEDFRNMDSFLASPDFSPQFLLDELLYAMPFTPLEDSTVRYACWCSRTRLITTALSTLPRADVEEMVKEGKMLEISCDYCHRQYQVAPTELQGLLQKS